MPPSIRAIITRLEREAVALGITCYPGATPNELAQAEATLGFALPADIRELYGFCNGFESAEDLFRIVPLAEAISYRSDVGPNQLEIAEYLVYSDTWTLEVAPTGPADYRIFGADSNSRRLDLTNSLSEFLDVFLNHGVFGPRGLYDWHEAIGTGQPFQS
jgi:hypothetical protein